MSEEELRERMKLVAPYTRWLRTFGASGGLEKAGKIAHSLNLQIAMGAWLGSDKAANEQEIKNLIAAAQAGEVDIGESSRPGGGYTPPVAIIPVPPARITPQFADRPRNTPAPRAWPLPGMGKASPEGAENPAMKGALTWCWKWLTV